MIAPAAEGPLARLHAQRPGNGLQSWAIGTLYAMAFCAPFSISLGQLAQTALGVVAGVFVYRNRHAIARSPLPWITLAFVAYVLLRGWVAATVERPDLAARHWEGTAQWILAGPLPMLVVAIGLVATGDWLRHTLGALTLLVAGCAVDLAKSFAPGQLLAALQGTSRYRSGIHLTVDGLEVAAILLGLLAFTPLLLSGRGGRVSLALRTLLWLALFTAGVTFLLALKTRKVWLAGLCGLVVLAAAAAICAGASGLRRLPGLARATLVLGAVLFLGLLVSQWNVVASRWHETSGSLAQLATTPLSSWGERLPEDSVGIRAAYLAVGLDYVGRRPLVGHGPADPRYLRAGDDSLPPKLQDRSGHFHNAHLDFLLRFGVLGYALVIVSIGLVLAHAVANARGDGAHRALGLFVLAFTASLLVTTLATTNMHHFRSIYFYALVFGSMWASELARRIDAADRRDA